MTVIGVSCTTATTDKTGTTTQQTSNVKILKVNEADWVDTDLGSTASLVPITVKLPKDAKLEKNGNGGVDITINDYYVITVSQQAVSSKEELIAGAKSLTVNRTDYYEKSKVLIDEPNGFVFTQKPKDEATFKYSPESHFFYCLETEGQAFFSFQDNEAFGSMNLDGNDFPEDVARKVYEIIKQSARLN